MLKQMFKILSIGILSMWLTACASHSGLSKKQITMLKNNGFVETSEGWSLTLPSSLLFEFDSATISQENQASIRALAENLNKNGLKRLKVIGHTDNVGSAEYNQKLSLERAKSVTYALYKGGYDIHGVEIIGRGMTQPIYPNDTEENRAQNRRVAIIIVR